MGWDWIFSSMPYGDKWRAHRRLFNKHFRPEMVHTYYPIQTKEVHTLLRSLVHSPDQFSKHVYRYALYYNDYGGSHKRFLILFSRGRLAASVVLMISYGYQVTSEDDAYVVLANSALSKLGQAGIFGTYLVDYIPLCKFSSHI